MPLRMFFFYGGLPASAAVTAVSQLSSKIVVGNNIEICTTQGRSSTGPVKTYTRPTLKRMCGRNNLSSQKLCSPCGNLPTTWSAQINASLSPNVFGTINNNTSTSASNHKYGPLSSRICLSLSGAESYQETENRNHLEAAEEDMECTVETTLKSSYNKNNGKQNKKRSLGNREIEKEREENTTVKKNKSNNIVEVTPANPTTHRDLLSSGNGDGDCPTPPVLKPRANKCSATKVNFRVYCHNVHGLRDETRLEHIPRIMKLNNLDANLIQETHLAGDFKKHIMFDYYIINHGSETQPSKGAKGGVAVILSPDLANVWKNSGKAKKCIKVGMSDGNTTRF
jgi:hypothetical protein